MTDGNNEEVKEFTQVVHVQSSANTDDDETTEEQEIETPESSSDEKKEPDDTEETPESDETVEQEAETPKTPKTEPRPVEGETPREKALRLEATRLKGLIREQRREELFVKQPTAPQEQDEELAQYDPDELKRFEALATKMGFAKKDEIMQGSLQERNNSEFETFMEAHPEYSPENDKDGALWNQFRSEFSLYNPPKDPKTLRKVLNKVHSEIYGVKPATSLNKINASREKIKVASHTGASAGKTTIKAPSQMPTGLRTDALKGFSDAEINEFLS